MKNSEQPAYPISGQGTLGNRDGLTKREYFAAMALQGLSTQAFDKMLQRESEQSGILLEQAIAVYAVEIADCLLKALES